MIVPPRAASGPPTPAPSSSAAPSPGASGLLTRSECRRVTLLLREIDAAPKNETFDRYRLWAEEEIERILWEADERRYAPPPRRGGETFSRFVTPAELAIELTECGAAFCNPVEAVKTDVARETGDA